MPARIDIRRISLTMALIVAMMTVIVPLCQMVDCSMSSGAMSHSAGAILSSNCDIGSTADTRVSSVAPVSSESLTSSHVALAEATLVIALPPRQLRFLRTAAEVPPTPPDDPRGVRLII